MRSHARVSIGLPIALLLVTGAGCFSAPSSQTITPPATKPAGTANSAPVTANGPGGTVVQTQGSLPQNETVPPSQAASSAQATIGTEPPVVIPTTTTIGTNTDAFMTPTGLTDEYRIIVHANALSESTVSVAKGTMVSWTNYDLTDHELVADDGSFDTGPLEITVPFFLDTSLLKPGSYHYHSTDAPTLQGTLIIR